MTLLRECMRDQVRRTLTERILSGHYRPGDRLVELQVARELGVSQGTVREALRDLEASRLTESEAHRGTRVRVVSDREIREGYVVRGALEEVAARTAAKAIKADATGLREAYRAILEAARRRDLQGIAVANARFHRLIVEASGNLVLLRLWDSLAFETRTRTRLDRGGTDLKSDAEQHLPIVEALERGDARTAGRLLREHAEFFASTITEQVPEPSPALKEVG